jgi:hypothetical protein
MQPELRGIIEQYIDFALSDAQMSGYQQYIDSLKPYVKSIEDAVFGLVVGMIIASCLDQMIFYTRIYTRTVLTPEQIEKLRETILDKIPKIRSRVFETLV